MSAQPNVDAGQIRLNRMKFAMAVGDNRHYVIDSIMPRHFLQTAAGAGVPPARVRRIFDELDAGAERAIDTALAELPPEVPERIITPVVEGVRRRLSLLAQVRA